MWWWFRKNTVDPEIREMFLARLRRLHALRTAPLPSIDSVLLAERAFVSTLLDCIRLGATTEALALLRDAAHPKRERNVVVRRPERPYSRANDDPSANRRTE